jgi:Fe-S cluster assembly iron-binding protein IscA
MNEDDVVVESNDIKIVFSKDLEGSLNNVVVDYINKWYSKGFRLLGTSTGSCF